MGIFALYLASIIPPLPVCQAGTFDPQRAIY